MIYRIERIKPIVVRIYNVWNENYSIAVKIDYTAFSTESSNLLNLLNPGSDKMKEYTKSQLALRNGSDREEIWCAYKGIIYDVKKSRLWRNGKHYEHWAGQDLTDELKDAPHNENVFDKFEVVGRLVN